MGKIIKNGIVFGGGSSDWTGTSANVNTAIDNGEITEGMTVNIIDDSADSTLFDDIKEYIDNQASNVLHSLEEVNASTSAKDVVGAAAVKELKNNIQTNLQANFQAGVDSVYNAVKAKGSTPASKSLSDVVAGINNIRTTPRLLTTGSGNGSYNCTGIANYSKLTSSNFLVVVLSINGSSASFSDKKDMTVNIDGGIGFNNPSVSYNSSNGIATISGMSYSYSMSKWWAGGAQSLWSGSNTYNWALYLV